MKKTKEKLGIIAVALILTPVIAAIVYGLISAFMIHIGFGIITTFLIMFFLGWILIFIIEEDL